MLYLNILYLSTHRIHRIKIRNRYLSDRSTWVVHLYYMYNVYYCLYLYLLQKPSKADSGDYKCSVKNKWGNDHTTFNLG